jgi:hypothetical protein
MTKHDLAEVEGYARVIRMAINVGLPLFSPPGSQPLKLELTVDGTRVCVSLWDIKFQDGKVTYDHRFAPGSKPEWFIICLLSEPRFNGKPTVLSVLATNLRETWTVTGMGEQSIDLRDRRDGTIPFIEKCVRAFCERMLT